MRQAIATHLGANHHHKKQARHPHLASSASTTRKTQQTERCFPSATSKPHEKKTKINISCRNCAAPFGLLSQTETLHIPVAVHNSSCKEKRMRTARRNATANVDAPWTRGLTNWN
jgi:hypothetical protein